MFNGSNALRIFLLLLISISANANAKCDDLLDLLSRNYPNRVFVENFGYDETYAVYEPSLTEEKSEVSIFKCVGNQHLNKAKFSFKVRNIAGLDFSDKYRRLFVYFVYETEQYGWIKEKDGS
jgi:hypothetical protein